MESKTRKQLDVWTFCSAILIGLLAHGYVFVNKFSYRDDIHMQDGVGATFSSGRWGLGICQKLVTFFGGGTFSLPWFNGIVSLLFLAVTAILLVRLFDVRNRFIGSLIAGVIVTFPAMTVLYSLMFTSFYYTFAIMISVLAVYLIEMWKRPVLSSVAAICMIAFSIGIYQAYIGFPVCCFLICYLLHLLGGKEETLKEQLFRALWYAGILVGGLVCYLIGNKVFLALLHIELTDYQGIGSMYDMSITRIIRNVIAAYANFFLNHDQTTVHTNVFVEKMRYMHILSLVLLAVLGGILLYRLIKQKRYKEGVLAVLVAMVFPLGVNLVYVMNASYMYQLMLHAKCMTFVLLFVLLEKGGFLEKGKVAFALRWLTLLLGVYMCVFYSYYANRCYQQAQVAQSRTIAWMTTLETQIKSQDGFSDSMQIAYLNEPCNSDLTYIVDSEFSNVELMGFTLDLRFYNSWRDFMKFWTGFHMNEVDETTYEMLREDPVIQAMPHYPNAGSIRIVDDIVVVNF